MRVLFLSQWFDPEPGAIRGLPFARWMKARGHDVEVLTGFPNYPGGKLYPGYQLRWFQREEMQGVPVVRVPLYPSHDRSPLRRIANFGSFALSAATLGPALTGGADVGYVYHPPATVGMPAFALKILKQIPFVYHIADMWPESVVESGMISQPLLRQAVLMGLSRWCLWVYRQAAAITVLSPGFKRLLMERGVPAEKIHVVYNWTDEESFRPLPRDEALAQTLGLAGRFNVVYAGNLGAFQGLDTVIEAACRIRDLAHVQIVIVGTGQQEDSLKALANAKGASNVRFVGRRQFWEMPQVNCLADVLLVHLKDFPFFSTTIPSKTQVSLASGRPVLMAVRGDAADVIRAAGAGLTCDPENPDQLANAIRQFVALDPRKREEMGSRGREYYLREMSLDVGGQQMENIFQGAIA